jgi:DNA repair protein RadC
MRKIASALTLAALPNVRADHLVVARGGYVSLRECRLGFG